ncbi:MAG: redoxin domain-containing protein [Candidatus Jordarchaeum sp.]|uniref:redoxin domain-containing protein n=1 Tax=Candidatus Jordarchaeum sp. TaxID=2823881 RepID=UPI0040492A2E
MEAQSIIVKEGKKSVSELLSEYQSIITKEPANPLGYVLAANIYFREESKALFEKAIKLSPNYAPAHIGLARYFMRYDHKDEAFEEYKIALSLAPKNKSLRKEAILAAVGSSKIKEAETIAGKDSNLRQEIIHALVDEGLIDQAEELMLTYGFNKQEGAAFLYLKGRILLAKGEKAGNQELIDQGTNLYLDSWRKDPAPLYHYKYVFPRRSLIQLLSKARRYSELENVLTKGLEIYPKEFSLYPELWKIAFSESKNNYQSIRNAVLIEVQSLLKNYPPSPSVYDAALQGYRMADAPEEVEKIRNLLLSDFPFSFQAQQIRQSLVIQEKNLEKRMILYEEFIQDFPNWPYAYQGYFRTAVELNVSNESLLKIAEEFLVKDKGDHSLQAVAEAFLDRKSYLDRVEKWIAASGKNPDLIENAWDVRILNLKAKLFLLQGKPNEAEKILLRLMNLEIPGLSNVDKGTTKFYLAEVYEAKKKSLEALGLCAEAYAQSQRYLVKAGDNFRRLYRQIYGTTKGMEQYLESKEKIYQSEEKVGGIGIERGTRIDEPAPDFELRSVEGKMVKLSSFSGKVVVLNFWATWCGPCNLELPHLQKLYEGIKHSNYATILTINTDENRALVEPFLRKNNYSFPVLYDDGYRTRFKVRGIPTTFIIDPSGRIRVRMVGFNPNEPLVPYLEELIEKFRIHK